MGLLSWLKWGWQKVNGGVGSVLRWEFTGVGVVCMGCAEDDKMLRVCVEVLRIMLTVLSTRC